MSDEIEISPDKQIIVKPRTVLCVVHGEHLREHWPKGFLMIGIEMVAAALSSEKLLAETSWSEGDEPPLVELNALLAQRPMCYWVEADVIRKALCEHVLERTARCDACGRIGKLGPYTTTEPDGSSNKRDVCVECVISGGERFHATYPDGPPADTRA